MQVVEDLANRVILADDLGLFPRRDSAGFVIVREPEVVYSELEDKILSFETSVYHPGAITVESEVSSLKSTDAEGVSVERQESEENAIVTEVVVEEESNYFWLYLLMLLVAFILSWFLILSRAFIHFLGNRRDGRGGSLCHKVANWLWSVRMWLLRRAALRFGNLGVVRKIHTRSAMRKYLRDYNFQLESWETAVDCAPSEALIAADQHILVRGMQKLLDLEGDLLSVERIKKIFRDYGVSNYRISRWLDKQGVRCSLLNCNAVGSGAAVTLAEGMLSLSAATFDQVLKCDVETQRGSPYFKDLVALQFAYRLVGMPEFSDFVVAYKGALYPSYVEAIKRHAAKLEDMNADDDHKRKNEKALEWLLMAGQGAFALTSAVSLGVFIFKIHKWVKERLLLRALATLPSVGGGGAGGEGPFSPEAIELFGIAQSFEERWAALHSGLDLAEENLEHFSLRELQDEIKHVVGAYADDLYHEADAPFVYGMSLNVDGVSDTGLTENASVGEEGEVSQLSLGVASKARRRSVGKSARMYPGGGSALHGSAKTSRVSGKSGVSGMKMKFTSKPLAT